MTPADRAKLARILGMLGSEFDGERTMPTPETSALPTVRQWQRDCRDDPDQATPKCPACGCHLGVREAMYNPSGTDEWECDNACCDGNGQ